MKIILRCRYHIEAEGRGIKTESQSFTQVRSRTFSIYKKNHRFCQIDREKCFLSDIITQHAHLAGAQIILTDARFASDDDSEGVNKFIIQAIVFRVYQTIANILAYGRDPQFPIHGPNVLLGALRDLWHGAKAVGGEE